VRVQITVRDRSTEASIPNDLMRVLRENGRVEDFKALPIGKKSYLLRLIVEARKPETRANRIRSAANEARRKRVSVTGRKDKKK